MMVLSVLPMSAARAAPSGYYTDQKVVYHNDGGPDNAAYFKKLLGNLRNHVAAVGKEHVEIRVVDHGDGIELLQMAKTDAALASLIDARKADGVHFLVCQNTLNERKIDWHTLYGVEEADIVPSGVAELARLQLMGFAYIHP
jgi:intracellular sulfur oxidation DsrE/DsrF family protein